MLLLLPLACRAEGEALESVQKTVSELVKVRSETTRLESDWLIEKELLASTTAAFEERAKDLERTRVLQLERGAKNAEELAQLREKNRSATAALETADVDMQGLGVRLLALRPALPPRLASALELSFKSLAENKLAAPERTRLTMSVLTRCLQFDGSVTRSEEVLELGGAARAVDVIYWGLSHAYAADRSSKKAWYGGPSGGRWQWQPVDASYEAIVELMAIQAGKADPAFVAVPAKVANPGKN